jgi:hypothetical protein
MFLAVCLTTQSYTVQRNKPCLGIGGVVVGLGPGSRAAHIPSKGPKAFYTYDQSYKVVLLGIQYY